MSTPALRSLAGRARLVLGALLAASACRGQPEATPIAASSSAVVEPPVILDPAISALARAAIPCALAGGTFDPSCAGMRAWIDARDPFTEGRADAALVAMLADPDAKVRYLASSKLNQFGRIFATDRELATVVVGAAARERDPVAGLELGAAVGRVAVGATGTYDRVAAIVKTHPTEEVREGVLSQLLFRNAADVKVFDLTRAAVDDKDTRVARVALHALWTGGTLHPDPTCQAYVDHLASADADIAAEAANSLAWFGKCSSRYDKLLDSLEARARPATGITDPAFATAARHLCEDPNATDAQRRRAAAIGRALVTRPDLASSVRLAGLDTADRCDRSPAGRAFVARLKADPDKAMADKAKELAGKK